jgi:lipopolysaccharide/colanic/teichoic acid biosynthesis glycosyltransferase
MTQDAEARLADMLRENDHVRQEFTAYHKLLDDPRLTRVGSALRRHSLDEIPQLWQVLAGSLSLVGPRAYLPGEQEEMGLFADAILEHRPGLTGWWQVNGRNAVTFQDRLALDLYYIRNWSPGMELAILLKTVRVVITGQGA